jgi:hypothetical protein
MPTLALKWIAQLLLEEKLSNLQEAIHFASSQPRNCKLTLFTFVGSI